MSADLSSMAPILKPLMFHAAKLTKKKGKATAAMKIKAKVSMKAK